MSDMLNCLDNICIILRATDNFCCKFNTFFSHLIDFVYYVFDGRAVDHNTIGPFAQRTKHGRNTEAQHETEKSGKPWYIKEFPYVAHILYLDLRK